MIKQFAMALACIGVLQAASLRVTFVSDPPGATVTVTDQEKVLFSGQTPTGKLVLKHKGTSVAVKATKEGYLPQNRVLTKQDNDTTILFHLEGAQKTIGIYCNVPGTEVFVDNERRGECGPTAPLFLSLRVVDDQQVPKTYRIRAKKIGWTAAEQTVSMRESLVPQDVRFSLQPEAKTLQVESSPPGASVFLDGVPLQKTTPCEVATHFINLTNQELKSLKVEVQLDGYEAADNRSKRPARIVEYFPDSKSIVKFELKEAKSNDFPGPEVIVLPTGVALGVRKMRATLETAEDSPTVASCTQITENRPVRLEEYSEQFGIPSHQLRELILSLKWEDIEKIIPPSATDALCDLLHKYFGAITSLTMSPDGKYVVYSELELAPARIDAVVSRKAGAKYWDTSAGRNRFEGESPIPIVQGRLSFTLRGTLKAIAVPGKGTTTVTDSAFIDKDPSFTPDGKYLYFASNRDGEKFSLWRVRFEPPTGTGITRITASVYADHEVCVCRSAGQQKLVFARLSPTAKAHEQQIWISELDGTLPTQFRYGFHPFWAPDGSSIAYARIDSKTGWNKIWVMRSDGAEQTQMTAGEGDDIHPAWSPDGKYLAYASSFGLDRNWERNYDIWVMRSDGTKATQLTTNGSEDIFPTWSPDGKYIYFVSNRGGAWNIWRLETRELP